MLTTSEAAALLGYTPAHIRVLVAQGKLRCSHRLGKYMAFSEEDLAQYVKPPRGTPVRKSR